ncbi:MAG: hypothetical protein ACRCTE_11605 [Cellulosilyticaceae bacterium]
MRDKCTFEKYLNQAVEAINQQQFDRAREMVMQAMILDSGAPQPHNLLGILAEYESDRQLAARHYRAAMALEPTYLPAQNNLARVTSSNGFITKPRDFGEQAVAFESAYEVEFDSQNIGHIKKKKR